MDVSRSEAARQSSFDEEQFNRYVAQRKQQQAEEIANLEQDHKKALDEMGKEFKKEEADANRAYRVELQRTVDVNNQKLADVNKSYEEQLKHTKEENAKEFQKISERERKRIEAYKKNQDASMQKMHDHYVATETEMSKDYES